MSYQTYTTEALVCGSFDSSTADKSFLLFTRKAGMLYATARSVREERSRQRYALQPFSRISISLVRGKSGWRIGSVEALENLFAQAPSRLSRGSVVSVMKLIRQYIHGEETSPALYDEVVQGMAVLVALPDDTSREEWEAFIKARILYKLGYISPVGEITTLITLPLANVPESTLGTHYAVFSKYIEDAKQVSHLAQ